MLTHSSVLSLSAIQPSNQPFHIARPVFAKPRTVHPNATQLNSVPRGRSNSNIGYHAVRINAAYRSTNLPDLGFREAERLRHTPTHH